MLQQINRAAKKNTARISLCFAGDDVHHRCLARTIGADDATQLPGGNIQRQVVDGFKTIKAHIDVFQVQDTAVGGINLAAAAQAREPSVWSATGGLETLGALFK